MEMTCTVETLPINKGGRPSEFTPENRAAILEAVRLGLPECRAAELCGLDPSTLAHWKARGREETSGPYFDFLMDMKGADAHCERALLTTVRKAAEEPKHWTAAMTLLERKWPKRWAKLDRVAAGGLTAEERKESLLNSQQGFDSYTAIMEERKRVQMKRKIKLDELRLQLNNEVIIINPMSF